MARILMIEDSPTAVSFVRECLAADAHEVDVLGTYVELRRCLEESPPDLVLLDLNIPGLDGEAMGHRVRSFQHVPIPIVIYSSEPEERIREAAAAVGAAGYARKCDSADAVRWVVNRALIASLLASCSQS